MSSWVSDPIGSKLK